MRALLGTAVGAVAAAHLLPSVLTIPGLHRRVVPALSGVSAREHVALTFDDGPHPSSTRAVLDALERLDVRATFFLLGHEVVAFPDVAREIVARGHEVGVHAWKHVPHLLRTPWGVWRDVARTCSTVADVTGTRPVFWRPPNGIVTGAGLLAARRAGLVPVLWTADGQDWAASATDSSVVARVGAQVAAGGTVLLHDSDITSAPGSWRATLAALPQLVEGWRARGWEVGPLRDHWRPAPEKELVRP